MKWWVPLFTSLTLSSSLSSEEAIRHDLVKAEVDIENLEDAAHVLIAASLLYWQGGVSGLELANLQINSGNNSQESNTFEEMPFEWGPGFRIVAGYLFPGNWKIGAEWTSFHKTSRETFTTDLPIPSAESHTQNFLPIWDDANTNPQGYFWQTNGNYSFRFDGVNIGFAWTHHLTHLFHLVTNVGFRFVHLNNLFHIQDSSYLSGSYTSDTKLWNRFNGYGLFAGFGASWKMGKGFSFYGDTQAALSYGRFYKARFSHITPATGLVTGEATTFTTHALCPELEVGVGFLWSKRLEGTLKWISVNLGYEFHALFGMSKLWKRTINSTDNLSNFSQVWVDQNESLFLQGVNLGLALGF